MARVELTFRKPNWTITYLGGILLEYLQNCLIKQEIWRELDKTEY